MPEKSTGGRPTGGRPEGEPRAWKADPPPVELVRWAPEPANLWIEASPRWRGRDDVPWIDLRTLDLGGAAHASRGAQAGGGSIPGTLYLPPPESAPALDQGELVPWALATGAAVIAHTPVGEEVAPGGATALVDLLAALLEQDLDRVPAPVPDALLLWPLIPGVTDAPALIDRGLDRLERLGWRAVTPFVPALSPRARRRLGGRLGPVAFNRLFGGGSADPRAFASAAVARGLDPLARRTLASSGPRRLERRVAAELALIAELLPAVGGSEPAAQIFFRAARWFETTERDVPALWREGNLAVVPWIDAEIEALVGELAAGAERSTLLARLTREWVRATP